MGITDVTGTAETIRVELNEHGVDPGRVAVMSGMAGLEQFDKMMRGSQWGEQAEKLRAQGQAELKDGHAVISVEVADQDEAVRVARWLTPLGVHSLHHFGALIDTQLTA
jgi:hypothetical protein